MAGINLNTLFDKLTNFKIKFKENPSPTQISNKDLVFHVVSEKEEEYDRVYEFKDIIWDQDCDVIEIVLE
ncbi:hypothetical protein KAR91_45690 [Candidatus Pacearchaeota archaeon]|nr:hypothetical protein [Candidatus Pacearchaeota archaeon]